MLYCAHGSSDTVLSDDDLRSLLKEALEKLGDRKRVLAIPPDFTRFHSKSGVMVRAAWEHYQSNLIDVLPAIGTHSPMSESQIATMFGPLPPELVRVHNFREELQTLGRVPAEFVHAVSEGKLDYDWPAEVNRLLPEGGHDLILSIGQVVPHEVIGMANHNKNIFIGTGGSEAINKSHFLGAVYGLERIMGRADTPVRALLDYASEHFATNLPIVYALSVVGRGEGGELVTRGLFVGDDRECFNLASDLSLEVNFTMIDVAFQKVVVYLDPAEFKSTWLGNKAVYRTRMAIADGGELIVLAPGVREFGEDSDIDRLIRKFGYVTTPEVMEFVDRNQDLRDNLSAAAHLIQGSSENRFSITYCPGHLTRKEIEGVNYRFASIDDMTRRYDPAKLSEGWNTLPDGERIYYISNPAIGLWSQRDRFNT